MAHLIDKSALVAEIKRLIRANELYLSKPETDEVRFQKTGAYSVLNDLLHFLDTIEVKEVDLVKEFDKEFDNEFFKDPVFGKLVNRNAGISIAKHFYELGINTKA